MSAPCLVGRERGCPAGPVHPCAPGSFAQTPHPLTSSGFQGPGGLQGEGSALGGAPAGLPTWDLKQREGSPGDS